MLKSSVASLERSIERAVAKTDEQKALTKKKEDELAKLSAAATGMSSLFEELLPFL